MKAAAEKQLTGRHVLMALAAFFGVMLIANGIFLYMALSTFNGMDDPKAYQVGLDYNERIEAARKQAELGWSHRLEISPSGRIELGVSDKSGDPVSGLAFEGTIRRPVDSSMTRDLTFNEVGIGTYAATAEDLPEGSWIVSVKGAKSSAAQAETVYRLKERLWLKPNS